MSRRIVPDQESIGRRWLVVLAKVPTEPARHRMALWRELRRSGRGSGGAGDLGRPGSTRGASAAAPAGRYRRGRCRLLLVLQVSGYADRDTARLEQLYVAAREAEWAEFLADCAK